MQTTPKKNTAQGSLAPWIDDAHRLDPDEAIAEAEFFALLVEVARPPRPDVNAWANALAVVMALPPVGPGGRGVAP